MAFVKNSAASGKKLPAGSGANGAAYRKNLAATKRSKTAGLSLAAVKRGGLSKQGKKSPSASPAYSSLRSRQMLLEKLRRQIWASVADINNAIVNAAKAGNLQAAKALFDFAGVYSLPEMVSEEKAAVVTVEVEPEPDAEEAQEECADAADMDPVDAFFCSIGMAPAAEENEQRQTEAEVRMG